MGFLPILRFLSKNKRFVTPVVAATSGVLLCSTAKAQREKTRSRSGRCHLLGNSGTPLKTPASFQPVKGITTGWPSISRFSSVHVFKHCDEALEQAEQSVVVTLPLRLLTACGPVTVTSCEMGDEHLTSEDPFSEPARFEQSLEYHRSLLHEYRQKWDYNNLISRTPTTTGWPKYVPAEREIPMLEFDFQFASGKYRDDLQFRLALHYLDRDVSRAFRLLQDLALREHADAMCLLGVVWNEGRYADADPKKACMWFRRAADLGHTQACYEMGVALYTGEGVAESEQEAVEYFERAAWVGHAAAAYMLGDCLLDGVGVIRDRAEALEWLVAAGELGHRGARSRVLAVLEKDDGSNYGEFTDASRQTFKRRHTFKRKVEDDVEEKKWNEQDLMRLVTVERKFTIGGGSRNPVVLARRKSVVDESRDVEEDGEEDDGQPFESEGAPSSTG